MIRLWSLRKIMPPEEAFHTPVQTLTCSTQLTFSGPLLDTPTLYLVAIRTPLAPSNPPSQALRRRDARLVNFGSEVVGELKGVIIMTTILPAQDVAHMGYDQAC